MTGQKDVQKKVELKQVREKGPEHIVMTLYDIPKIFSQRHWDTLKKFMWEIDMNKFNTN